MFDGMLMGEAVAVGEEKTESAVSERLCVGMW